MSTGMRSLPQVAGKPMPLKVIGPASCRSPADLAALIKLLIGVLMVRPKPVLTLIMPVASGSVVYKCEAGRCH